MKTVTGAWLLIVNFDLAIGIYLAQTYNYIEMVEAVRDRWEPW